MRADSDSLSRVSTTTAQTHGVPRSAIAAGKRRPGVPERTTTRENLLSCLSTLTCFTASRTRCCDLTPVRNTFDIPTVNDERIARRRTYLALALATVVLGCKPGLPPEGPGRDAAEAEATATRYDPPSNPYTSSAFAGAKLPASSGHEGMEGMEGMEHMEDSTSSKDDAQSSAGESEPSMPDGHKSGGSSS